MEREIIVMGRGEVRVLPDRATFRVAVDGAGSSPEEAYEAAARASAAVDAVMNGDDGFDRVHTAGVMVEPRTRWQDGEPIRSGWTASRASTVSVKDLSRLGDLLLLVATAGGGVSGIAWDLDPGHEAMDRARHAAALDARRRAETYA